MWRDHQKLIIYVSWCLLFLNHHVRKSRYVGGFTLCIINDTFLLIGHTDELVAARTELARLRQEEQQLVKQLLDIRVAANVQKIKIDALVRERNRTISRFPMELLVQIFDLYIHLGRPGGIYWRMHQLARVSRHWRDTILCTPTFWTHVMISPDDIPFLKTRLKRSRSAPLDIVVIDWTDVDNKTELTESLRIIAPCANRWRSLTVDKIARSFVALVINEINRLELPFCRRVNINARSDGAAYWHLYFPGFLSSIPALEHISLEHFVPPLCFPTLSKLKTLELTSVGFRSLSLAVLFSQTLTKLSLFGITDAWLLEPDSIKFLALRTLVLHVYDPKQLLEQSQLQCSNALTILTSLWRILILWSSAQLKINSMLSTILPFLLMENRITLMTRVVLPSVKHFQVSVA